MESPERLVAWDAVADWRADDGNLSKAQSAAEALEAFVTAAGGDVHDLLGRVQ